MSGRKGPVKPVFSSPGQIVELESGSVGSQMDNLVTRHSFPDDVKKSYNSMKREEHEKRVKNLRKELDYINKTAWQFLPSDKLLGGGGNTNANNSS